MKTSNISIRNSFKEEVSFLQKRIFALQLLEFLYQHNPPFYDEKLGEIVEPYRTIFSDRIDVIDDERFLDTLYDFRMFRNEQERKLAARMKKQKRISKNDSKKHKTETK